MFKTQEQLVDELKGSGAIGSPAALVSAVWDLLNLPGSGKMAKVSGCMIQRVVIDSKGILVQVRLSDTIENIQAVEQMRNSGNGIALMSQEPEEAEDDDPNQGTLPLDGEESEGSEDGSDEDEDAA